MTDPNILPSPSAAKSKNVVLLRPGLAHQPSVRPPTKEVVDQQRIIRDLSARYRDRKDAR
jgi:hypothetical protein